MSGGRREPVRRMAAGSLLMFLYLCGHVPLKAQAGTATVADTVVLPEDAAARSSEAFRAPGGWPPDAHASPLLPPGHWAVRAAARAEALGLADGYLPAQRAVPRAVVLAALEHAAAEAQGRGGALRRMAEGWAARFREEFAEYGTDLRGDALLAPVNGRAAAGWADEQGRLSPARGYFDTRRDPEALPAIHTPRLDVALGTLDRRYASAWAQARWDEAGVDLARWDAAVSLGPVGFSAGKQPVAYGWGEGGGVALSETTLPRVEAQTLRPVHLPGFLRRFGGVSLHTFLSRTGGARHPDEPWMWGARLSFRPHRRLAFAVNRASLFGGRQGVTPRRLAGMLVGVLRNEGFENQVLSFEGRWRLPTDALLPATVYAEWGADDGAGALNEVPGRRVGILVPALPGAPQAEAGAEYARFEKRCCGHAPWYYHYTFPGNWARGTRPLGHPLGGEGWEASAFTRAETADARLRVGVRGLLRERWDASLVSHGGGNLYTPARTGRSTGFGVDAQWRWTPRTELRAAAFREAGDGWSERSLDASLAVFF